MPGRNVGDDVELKLGQQIANLQRLKGDEDIILRAELENLGHCDQLAISNIEVV
jgi:hypothetical protein